MTPVGCRLGSVCTIQADEVRVMFGQLNGAIRQMTPPWLRRVLAVKFAVNKFTRNAAQRGLVAAATAWRTERGTCGTIVDQKLHHRTS